MMGMVAGKDISVLSSDDARNLPAVPSGVRKVT